MILSDRNPIVAFVYGIIDIELDDGKVNLRLGDGIGHVRSMNGLWIRFNIK